MSRDSKLDMSTEITQSYKHSEYGNNPANQTKSKQYQKPTKIAKISQKGVKEVTISLNQLKKQVKEKALVSASRQTLNKKQYLFPHRSLALTDERGRAKQPRQTFGKVCHQDTEEDPIKNKVPRSHEKSPIGRLKLLIRVSPSRESIE